MIVGGREVRITHPGRVLWPVTGTTKSDLLAYLLAVAPALLPHLAGRPVMLWRFPEGIDGPGWFQANCRGRPDWLPIHEIVGRRGATLRYCIVEEPAALAWVANLGTIELHPFLWTVRRPHEPTALVLDLDPGPPAGLVECARVALRVRARLEGEGLDVLVKTSGGLGLHVLAPLGPGETFERTKTAARNLARDLSRETPDAVVASANRAERAGRVFVDWVENDANRQLVAPYSLRATPAPLVSAPVGWDEVEAVAMTGRPGRLRLGPDDVLARLERDGDPFAAARAGHRRLPEALLRPASGSEGGPRAGLRF